MEHPDPTTILVASMLTLLGLSLLFSLIAILRGVSRRYKEDKDEANQR